MAHNKAVKDIRIEEFDYELPEERIPRHPLVKRDACRLLLSRPDGRISHRRFSELPSLLPPSTVLFCNDTRVINARLSFSKDTGARIEIFLLEPIEPHDYVLNFQTKGRCSWKCMVGNLKKWKEGSLKQTVKMPSGKEITLSATRLEPLDGNSHAVEFQWDDPSVTFATVIEQAGFIPIPPYLKRESEETDKKDYQTVYAEIKGSVAAPTAGLHFTPALFEDLAAHNIPVEKLTLHVGAGTFQPVKSSTIGDHPMHTETFSVSLSLLNRLIDCKKEGRPVAAVGTTTVRTLESLPYLAAAIGHDSITHVGQWTAYSEDFDGENTISLLSRLRDYMTSAALDEITATTAIMIAPGFRWRVADILITNFHQPQSTLLLLVSSFLGAKGDIPHWRKIYQEALQNDYRFLSYGDACLLFPLQRVP